MFRLSKVDGGDCRQVESFDLVGSRPRIGQMPLNRLGSGLARNSLGPIVRLVCIVAICFCGTATMASPVSADQLQDWVTQLGDDQFSAREEATRQLIEAGAIAVPYLEQVVDHSDREIRFRARRILTVVQREDLESRFRRFRLGEDLRDEEQLPGWEAFHALVGDTTHSRQMLIEMNKSELTLMQSLSDSDETASVVLTRRINQLYETRKRKLFETVEPSTLIAILLVASREDISLDRQSAQMLHGLLADETEIAPLKNGRNVEYVRVLLAPWLMRATDQPAYQVLSLGLKYGIQEVMNRARDVLAEPDESTSLSLRYALQTVGRFGDASDIGMVIGLIGNETRIAARTSADEVRVTYLGDLALAICLHLGGFELDEFGFDVAVRHEDLVFVESSLGFLSEQARTHAIDRWFETYREPSSPSDFEPNLPINSTPPLTD